MGRLVMALASCSAQRFRVVLIESIQTVEGNYSKRRVKSKDIE